MKRNEKSWSGRPDLNRGPLAPKASALPGCATPRIGFILPSFAEPVQRVFQRHKGRSPASHRALAETGQKGSLARQEVKAGCLALAICLKIKGNVCAEDSSSSSGERDILSSSERYYGTIDRSSQECYLAKCLGER